MKKRQRNGKPLSDIALSWHYNILLTEDFAYVIKDKNSDDTPILALQCT